jgi:hypothetical protein
VRRRGPHDVKKTRGNIRHVRDWDEFTAQGASQLTQSRIGRDLFHGPGIAQPPVQRRECAPRSQGAIWRRLLASLVMRPLSQGDPAGQPVNRRPAHTLIRLTDRRM